MQSWVTAFAALVVDMSTSTTNPHARYYTHLNPHRSSVHSWVTALPP